jgi:hypothetical protein
MATQKKGVNARIPLFVIGALVLVLMLVLLSISNTSPGRLGAGNPGTTPSSRPSIPPEEAKKGACYEARGLCSQTTARECDDKQYLHGKSSGEPPRTVTCFVGNESCKPGSYGSAVFTAPNWGTGMPVFALCRGLTRIVDTKAEETCKAAAMSSLCDGDKPTKMICGPSQVYWDNYGGTYSIIDAFARKCYRRCLAVAECPGPSPTATFRPELPWGLN